MKKNKMTGKQIGAILCIVLLVGLYVMDFILAITDNPNSMRMFAVSIVLTVIIPVFAYVYTMIFKMAKDRKEYNEQATSGKGSDK